MNTLLQARLKNINRGKRRALSIADESERWESDLFINKVAPVHIEAMRNVELEMIAEAERLAGQIYDLKKGLI